MKKKNILKIFILTILISVFTFSYNTVHFKGIVKNKYTVDIPGNWIVYKQYNVTIDTWFGEKTFHVENDTYEQVEVGNQYSFKKILVLDNFIKLK